MNQTRKIRWLLYHEPIELFVRTAEAFAKEIKQLTEGRIEIEVYTIKEYNEKFSNGDAAAPLALMQSGDIEMSQVQVGTLGAWDASDFFALELPFLFNSHDHATRVLEGDIGQGMLKGLQKTTPAHGLAFTYSGGFRCVAADRDITTVDDLVGLNMTTSTNPVMVDTALAFGCVPVSVHTRDLDPAAATSRQTSNAVETTLPRYKNEANPEIHTHVTNTKHSMYLTSIIVATEFWNSLSDADKAAMEQAALTSSRLERQWSIDDANKISTSTEAQRELGITYKEFSEEETAKLKQRVEAIYNKYTQFFTPGLVDGIIRA